MSSPELNYAIDHLALERLQTLLKKVCDESSEARTVVEAEILAALSTSQNSTGNKRPRFIACSQCKNDFDVTKNDDTSCQWHPGNLEVDWDGDFWADHDEDCHGEIDSDASREEYPEGFVWDCCNKNGESDPCETGKHNPDQTFVPTMKKRRMWE